MKDLVLSQQGKVMVPAAEFTSVEQALSSLDGEKHAQISLSDDEGAYVKVLGRKDILTISCGQRQGARISHYVLGLSKRAEEEIELSFGKFAATVQKNELMAYEDALLILKCFFQSEAFPAAYNMREIEKPLV